MTEKTAILPRLLRPPQAHAYLGMSRTAFDKNVRPYIKETKIGTRGVAFDRLELDRWAEQQNDSDLNSTMISTHRGKKCQRKAVSRVSSKGATFGISISRSQDMAAFAAALEQATGRKPKGF